MDFKNVIPSLVVFLISTTVHAAGFDCGGDLTKLEKVICSDQAASKLDSKLNEIYRRLNTIQNHDWVKGLSRIQSKWLRHRNTQDIKRYKFWLYDMYNQQIDRLEDIDRTAHPDDYRVSSRHTTRRNLPDLSSRAIQDIYIHVIHENSPGPYDIHKIADDIYLFRYGYARLVEGYRVYYDKYKRFIKVSGPSPSIKHYPTSQAPFFIFRSGGLRRGIASSTYSLTIVNLEEPRVQDKWLFSLKYDGLTGDCSRSDFIHLDVSTSLNEMRVKSEANYSLIEFEVQETNCSTLHTINKTYSFAVSKDGVLEKRSE